MPLTRQQRREINNRRNRRVFFLFMLWRMYSANTRAFWVHPLFEERRQKGEFYVLYPDLRHFTPKFFAMYRMNPRKFDRLLALVGPHLEKKWTKMRAPISPEQKLVVTLDFLATGASYTTLEKRYWIGKTKIHELIHEVCDVLWDVLQPREMAPPTTEEWRKIEQDFSELWNFPNCIGALDGKHVMMTSPPGSGSLFFNYKHTFSINLMALVDAHYRFIFVDIGQYGSNADGPVFQKSEFGNLYMKNLLNVPGPKYLPRARYLGAMPHVIVADEAFPLAPTIMRPYPKGRNAARMPRPRQIFNYRLSRARRIVENAFGILAQRWRIYNTRMWYGVPTVVKIVKATCILHNYLRDKNMNVANIYTGLNPECLDYLGENGAVVNLANLPGYRSSNEAQRIRRVFTHYFNSVAGRLHWQDARLIQRH